MNEKAKKLLQIFLGLASLGWANSLYTLYHRQALFVRGSEDSFCRINAKIDCDVVALSKYSAFLTIPTSAWGMVYYSALIVLALWAYFAFQDNKEEDYNVGRSIFTVLSLAGLVPTVILAGLSIFVIKSICLMCFLTYVINLGLAASAWALSKGSSSKITFGQAFTKIPQSLWITGVVLAALQFFAPQIIDSSVSEGPEIDDRMTQLIISQFNTSTAYNFKSENAPMRGNPNATVTVFEFSDFQCPHCARSAKLMPPILQSKGDNVKYYFKNYPLDNACNPNIKHSGHPFACEAAKAGICVFKNKGSEIFFNYKEETFANQATISSKTISDTAIKYGITQEQLTACLSDPSIHQELLDQVAEATSAKVEGTPAIFINGHFVATGPQPKILMTLLDQFIK